MSGFSALRASVVIAVMACLSHTPLAFGEPMPSSLIDSSKENSLKTLLGDIPHLQIEEVETLSPADQEKFIAIVLNIRAKYKAGISPLPHQFVNISESDTALQRKRDAYLQKSAADYKNFVTEIITVRQQFGLLSPASAQRLTTALLASQSNAAPQAQVAAASVQGPKASTTPGSKAPPSIPPPPMCGSNPYPVAATSNIKETFVCVCAGFANAGWEPSSREVTSINECGEAFIQVQANYEWLSLTTQRGRVCHHKKKRQSNFSRFMRKSRDLKCWSKATPTPAPKLETIPGSCDGGWERIIVEYSYGECPAGSKQALQESSILSSEQDIAREPNCNRLSWSHTRQKSGPIKDRTYTCDGSCIGCPPLTDGPVE